MKIQIDGETIFEVTDSHKKCLGHFTNKLDVDKHIKESIIWCAQSICETAHENLKKEWLPILFKRVKSIPTDSEELMKLIFSQSDYRDKYHKESIDKATREATFKVE